MTGKEKPYRTLKHRDAAGRVVTDKRGRNVFQWNKEEGKEIDNTSILVKRLDNKELDLERDATARIKRQEQSRPRIKKRRGVQPLSLQDDAGQSGDPNSSGDPYNSGPGGGKK